MEQQPVSQQVMNVEAQPAPSSQVMSVDQSLLQAQAMLPMIAMNDGGTAQGLHATQVSLLCFYCDSLTCYLQP